MYAINDNLIKMSKLTCVKIFPEQRRMFEQSLSLIHLSSGTLFASEHQIGYFSSGVCTRLGEEEDSGLGLSDSGAFINDFVHFIWGESEIITI